jgi:carboxymethylenebutenolidase
MAILKTSNLSIGSNGSSTSGYLVVPDDGEKHPGVVLIQEWWGLESHIIELSHKFAAEGFVILVPDHYHGRVVTEPDEAGKEMMMLIDNLERAIKEVGGAIKYLQGLPEVDPKKIGVIGFCMGGLLVWKAVERYREIGAAVPAYGVNYDPKPEEIAPIDIPILGIWGEHDGFIPKEAIEKIRSTYEAAGKNLTCQIYPAGHAFINPDHGNGEPEQAEIAFREIVNFLKRNLKS